MHSESVRDCLRYSMSFGVIVLITSLASWPTANSSPWPIIIISPLKHLNSCAELCMPSELIAKRVTEPTGIVEAYRKLSRSSAAAEAARALREPIRCYPLVNGKDGREGIFLHWCVARIWLSSPTDQAIRADVKAHFRGWDLSPTKKCQSLGEAIEWLLLRGIPYKSAEENASEAARVASVLDDMPSSSSTTTSTGDRVASSDVSLSFLPPQSIDRWLTLYIKTGTPASQDRSTPDPSAVDEHAVPMSSPTPTPPNVNEERRHRDSSAQRPSASAKGRKHRAEESHNGVYHEPLLVLHTYTNNYKSLLPLLVRASPITPSLTSRAAARARGQLGLPASFLKVSWLCTHHVITGPHASIQ